MESDIPGMPHGGWLVTTLSEEHGWISRPIRPSDSSATTGTSVDGAPDPGLQLKVGDKVRVLPNHSCPVANLSDEYVAVWPSSDDHTQGEPEGQWGLRGVKMEAWPVEARGAVARFGALQP